MDPLDSHSPDSFKSVQGYGAAEFVIEKSRFIGCAQPAATEAEARAFIADLRALHPQATHVCSAWIIGAGGLNMRFSDDGEPSGTAGVPMLEVLKREEVTDIVCAVVRYFGGIKLGAGRLVRAYTRGATEALAAAQISLWKRHRALTVDADYSFQGTISHRLAAKDWLWADTSYDDKVHYSLFIPAELEDAAAAEIADWTKGKASLRWGELVYKG